MFLPPQALPSLSFAENVRPYSHHNSFPDQWLLNVRAGSIARRKLSWVSQAAPLRGRTPKAPGDNTASTPATGQHLKPEEGRGGSLSHLLSAYPQQTTSYKLIQSLEVQHDHWEDTVNYPLIKLQLDIQHLEWRGFLSKIWRGKGKFWLWVSNPSPATWPWPNLLTFWSLCFLVFKMGTGIIPTPPG